MKKKIHISGMAMQFNCNNAALLNAVLANGKSSITSMRQISKPALFPAFAKAGFMTGRPLSLSCTLLALTSAGLIIPDARFGVVPAEQRSVKSTTSTKLKRYKFNSIFYDLYSMLDIQ